VNALDYLILFGSILAIAVYGILRTRGRRNLHDYLRGKSKGGGSWFAIGLSVMATQASAITFLSTPGQGYADGMSFVQNYFALPVALVIIAAFFLPIYRKLNVYTAYEYLGKRFDTKTRLLAAGLFLLQRALGAGYTLYAPAIVLSTVFGWSLSLTLLASGAVVIAYTVAGGSDAVTHTQKYQLGIIFVGMITAFCILLSKIPCSFGDALVLAGHFGKTNAVSFNPDPRQRYTFWTGMLGGLFLMLSYFGTDQSQVQRYISGDNLRESRLGLMFNALFKIPMQFGILLLGVMLFVFYLFHPAPIFFNKVEYGKQSDVRVQVMPMGGASEGVNSGSLAQVAQDYSAVRQDGIAAANKWVESRRAADSAGQAEAISRLEANFAAGATLRHSAVQTLKDHDSSFNTNDADYVFITFILDNLPHGLIGLLVACFFLAALSSKAAELNALASCSVIDFYRLLIRPPTDDDHSPNHAASAHDTSERHYVRVSRGFTLFWGLVSLSFALFLFTHFAENLIQATNIVGSLFYGSVLALFLMAFFFKFIHGNAAFFGALTGQLVVFAFFAADYFGYLKISYLWYNLIGCLAAIVLAVLLQLLIGQPGRGFPILAVSGTDDASIHSER
jgi:Na+/proline symporter